MIYIGADHRGFGLKEKLKKWLTESGHEVEDCGAFELDADDDYVDFAQSVAGKVQKEGKGILICGSGHGVDMVANRFLGVRSVLGFNDEVTKQGRAHEDANVVSIPSDWVDEEQAKKIVENFLGTEFGGEERHGRRIAKLGKLGGHAAK